MHIDSDGYFQDLDEDSATEILSWAEDVTVRGRIAYPRPDWVQEWLDVMMFDERQALLVTSTVLPQRVLLSLVRYYRDV
jgi:hypothetical protein